MSKRDGYAEIQRERQRAFEAQKHYETLATADQAKFRRLIKLWIAVGIAYYFFLVVVALLAVALVGLMVFYAKRVQIHIILATGAFVFAIGSALFIKLPPPKGRRTSRAEFPKLWAMVDEVTTRLKAPKVDEIFLNLELNASAAQSTRYLLSIGRPKNVLTVGIPYLLSTAPDETKATIAHEMGHFAGEHSRSTIRAYRFSSMIAHIAERYNGRGGVGAWLTMPFLKWYMPRFQAVMAPLSRVHEFEADAAATGLGLGPANRSDLIRMNVTGPWYYRRFIPRWLDGAIRSGDIATYLRRMQEALSAPLERSEAEKMLRKAIEERTGPESSHPALTERVSAFAEAPTLADLDQAIAPRSPNAAETFLGEGWLDRIAPDLFQAIFGIAATEIPEEVRSQPPVLDQIDEAEMAIADHGLEAGAPVLLAAVESPTLGRYDRYRAAEILLREEHPEAVHAVSKFVDDPAFGINALSKLFHEAERRGETVRARSIYAELEKRGAIIDQWQHRLLRGPKDLRIEAPTLPKEALDIYMQQLLQIPQVSAVYTFDVVAADLPRGSVVLIDVTGKQKGFQVSSTDAQSVANAIHEHLSGPISVLKLPLVKAKQIREYALVPGVVQVYGSPADSK